MRQHNKTILLALSGGVDSTVAALILKKQRYKVIAAFMKCFSDNKNTLTGECNWIEERKMAQKIAAILNIPFITLDFEKEYKKQVIDPMYKAYSQGLTPNPDIACNTIIKFPLLWKAAQKYKADYIATGHYARIKKTSQGYQLLAGKDKLKDQSYFLYELSQSDLSHTLFPIGNYTKEKIRQIAKKNNLPNWNKKGTRGICFIGKVYMKNFLEKKIKSKKGIVKDPDNNIIGTHHGSSFYTIGQRVHPSLGIDITKPQGQEQLRWYIAEKLSNNVIIAAPEGHPILKKSKIFLKSLNLINSKEKIPTNLKGRIRHLGEFHKGKLSKHNNRYLFTLSFPVFGLAEGQHLVLYHKDKIVGGGEIRLK